MTTSFSFREGQSPLLVSVPHDGRLLPADVANRMTAAGLALSDTDWNVARLYDFVEQLDASMIVADYSRYVVDLNRSPVDEALYENQLSTGLCPTHTFAGEAIYQPGCAVTAPEQLLRVEEYWRPYHQCLQNTLGRLQEQFGYALLWDAHSIRGVVPTLFDGELPVLNIGSNGGASCDPELIEAVMAVVRHSDYSSVHNGRFSGGYITRNYGLPKSHVHALQLELAQHSYMDENTLRYDFADARSLAAVIEKMLRAFVDAAKSAYRN